MPQFRGGLSLTSHFFAPSAGRVGEDAVGHTSPNVGHSPPLDFAYLGRRDSAAWCGRRMAANSSKSPRLAPWTGSRDSAWLAAH